MKTANIESCWIEIIKPKAEKLLVCSVYRPPDSSLDAVAEVLDLMFSNVPGKTETILL